MPFVLLRFLKCSFTAPIWCSGLASIQGLYNLLVYMSPKVREAKKSKRENLTWRQAFVKARMSKGRKTVEKSRRGISITNVSASLKQVLQNIRDITTSIVTSARWKKTNTKKSTASCPEDSAGALSLSYRSNESNSEEDYTVRKKSTSDDGTEEGCEEEILYQQCDELMEDFQPPEKIDLKSMKSCPAGALPLFYHDHRLDSRSSEEIYTQERSRPWMERSGKKRFRISAISSWIFYHHM